MKQIKLGMRWTKDWHDFEVTKVFKNGKVQITETWVSEDTWEDCKDVRNYNVSEDENGQFVWQDQYKEYAFDEKETDGYHWWARMYAAGSNNSMEEYENEITEEKKEDKNMKETKRAQGAVDVMDFEFDGIRYTNTRPGYYYKKENGKQVRIGKAEWDTAWEASGEAEKQAREAEQAKADREAEKAMKKAEKKPRRSKDIAFEGCGVTLTTKQVEFLGELPKSEIWDGYKNGIWCDCIADGIEWNPMSVGAMISTLREKGLVEVNVQKINGKKCKEMLFTALGLDVIKKMGLK